MTTNSKNRTPRVINMTEFGINTLVETTQGFIDKCMSDFANRPDKTFMNGQGKKALLKFLEAHTAMDDDFFDEDVLHQSEYPERWQYFMDDCVCYACLSSYLTGKSIPLIEDTPVWAQMELIMKYLGKPGVIHDINEMSSPTEH